MQILIDDQPCDATVADDATIEALIEQVRRDHVATHRMIVSIYCNGQAVPDDQIEALLSQRVTEFERIGFGTCGIAELGVLALEDAAAVLAATQHHQSRTVALLSADQNNQAMTALGECINGWFQAHDTVVKTVQMTGLNLSELTHGPQTLNEILNHVAHLLSQLKECLEAADYVLLNDLLQYEIIPSFDQWRGLVAAMITELQATDQNRPR